MSTLSRSSSDRKTRHLNLAECMAWTPSDRPGDPQERATASCYEPPAAADEAWFNGLQCGLDRLAALPPEGYSNAERRAFLIGYEAGLADDTGEDWTEFAEWLDAIDSMHATQRDEQDEAVARCEFSGHGGCADLD